MARPSKYTPEVVKRVTDAIKLGATYELAAAYAGIAESTFYDWQAKKPEFSEAVKSAEGTAAVGWLARIEQAASAGNWTAAAWKLERRYPEMYGRTVQDQRHSDLRTHAEQVAAELGLDADARARLIDYAAEKKQRRAS
jgi:transposase